MIKTWFFKKRKLYGTANLIQVKGEKQKNDETRTLERKIAENNKCQENHQIMKKGVMSEFGDYIDLHFYWYRWCLRNKVSEWSISG